MAKNLELKTGEYHKGMAIFLKRGTAKKNWSHVSLFKLLADRNRYRCIVLLMRAKSGESVSTIADALNMRHSSVSHLLALLHEAKVVVYKKKGREVLYMMAKTPQAKRVVRLLRTV